MANQQRTISFRDGMALGIGIDDLTGEVGSLEAVSFEKIVSAAEDEGMDAQYDTSLIHSSEQMYESLGLSMNAEGRYGFFNAEGKFKFAEESRFNSTSTFLVARASIQNSFKRITGIKPTGDAIDLITNGMRDKFRKRYGDLFIRGIKSGGEYIAVLSITSHEQHTQRELAAELKASLDVIVASGTASIATQQKISELRQRSEVRVSVYQKGGAGEQISYTGTIEEVMSRLKNFALSVQENPKAYSVQAAPYDTLIFPDEPNWFDIKKQQEVIEDCLKKRLKLLQLLNDLEILLLHPDYFKTSPSSDTISAWNAEITTILNKLDKHVSEVIDKSDSTEYFPLTLPENFVIPERVKHNGQMVEIFTHADYAMEWNGISGMSQQLSIGKYDNSQDQILLGNDQISSLKIPEGLAVRAYEHAWFQGAYIDFTANTPKIPTEWNDRISSLIIYKAMERPPRTDFIVAADYTWSRPVLLLKAGEYPDLNATSLGASKLSTLLIPNGIKVTLWDQKDFQGTSVDLFTDALDLPAEWNNRAASMQITQYSE